MPMNSKGSLNYSCLIFSLPAVSCNFIFFFCTDPCASRNLTEQITESSELDFLEIFPLQKQASKCQIHLKLAIIIIRLKSAILKNASKVFSLWACVPAAWCFLFKWRAFNLAAYCEFQWRYSLAPPKFIKLSQRRRIHILHIWHTRISPISHGLFPYKEHIKQPRLRRHGTKTPQKKKIVFTLFQINFYHSYPISFKLMVICWWIFFGV